MAEFLIFKCDIPVVFYKFNMYSVQLVVKTQLIYIPSTENILKQVQKYRYAKSD